MPKSLDPEDARPEECIPCILLTSPAARFFILYLHSNAEDLGRCYSFCSALRLQFQVHVLVVEYPGYGICPGKQATEESVTENAFVAFNFIRQVLNWPLDEIILFGRSIGCGPALAIAAKYKVYGLILVCPFLSVRELCREFLGGMADFIDERFPNKEQVARVSSQLLVVHGRSDGMVPWSHGKALYDACRARKRLVTPENMKHNSNLYADPAYFVVPMLQFFALPDYSFEDFHVPPWVFDKRLCHLNQDTEEVPLGMIGGESCLHTYLPRSDALSHTYDASDVGGSPQRSASVQASSSSRGRGPGGPVEGRCEGGATVEPLPRRPPAEAGSRSGPGCGAAPPGAARPPGEPPGCRAPEAGGRGAGAVAPPALGGALQEAARRPPGTGEPGEEQEESGSEGGQMPQPPHRTDACNFKRPGKGQAQPGGDDVHAPSQHAMVALEKYLLFHRQEFQDAENRSLGEEVAISDEERLFFWQMNLASDLGVVLPLREEELPSPPEDAGFLKVPRSHASRPGLAHTREAAGNAGAGGSSYLRGLAQALGATGTCDSSGCLRPLRRGGPRPAMSLA